jgi:glycosyltransferase involved in cell wall biosynthesis
MNPEICVMMPTFGQSEYLGRAIRSLMASQIPTGMFIVYVDSDSATKDELEGFNGQSWLQTHAVASPNVWMQKHDALRLAGTHLDPPDRNQLVCRFDSDDIMAQGWLEKAIPIAREIQSRGKVPIIGPSYVMTDESLKPTQKVILPEFSLKEMLESCIIPEYSIMPIGPMLEVGGFYPSDYPKDVPDRYRWYAMMLKILKGYDCEVRLLPDIGFYYRQHRGQEHNRFISKWRSKKNVQMIQKVSKHYFPEG